jgi:CRP/FNR family transcriptional regulator, cyclic AMP receptor protein
VQRRPEASLPLHDHRSVPAALRAAPGCVTTSLVAGAVLAERDGEGPWRLVEAGAVALCCTSTAGRRCVLRVAGPGDLLPGDLEGPGEPGRALESRALVSSTLRVIPSVVIERMIFDDEAVAWWVCSKLRRHLAQLERDLEASLTLSVHGRVERALAKLAVSHGQAVDGGTRITVPLSQDTLASIVGATRESVNRSLRMLMAQGAVRRSRGWYVVSDGRASAVRDGLPLRIAKSER